MRTSCHADALTKCTWPSNFKDSRRAEKLIGDAQLVTVVCAALFFSYGKSQPI